MREVAARWAVLAACLVTLLAGSRAQAATPDDARVQAPELRAPERGSLVGQLAATVFGPADVSRGAFHLPSAFAVASERAPLLASPFPVYTPEAGLSEWGLGWQASLSIQRTRLLGDVDFATDDLSGPWGRMVLGNDGAYYPQGLTPPVRVEVRGDELTAHLPDGATWTFGGATRVATARGTFAWALREARSATGATTWFSYEANPSGRLFVTRVEFGTRADASLAGGRVDLEYEPLEVPLREHRSGEALVLDRRVRAVRVSTLGESGPALRWHYELAYAGDETGPGFWLERVTRFFASGVAEPPVRYTYRRAAAHLAEVSALEAPALAALVGRISAEGLQRSAFVDVDEDGRPDVELGGDLRLFHQGDATFEEVPNPAAPNAEPWCRPMASALNPARTFARLNATDGELSAWVLRPAGVNRTQLKVCSREGALAVDAVLDGPFELGATTKLVDLDRDRDADLVRMDRGSVEIVENTSHGGAASFALPRRVRLTPAFEPTAAWVVDANGDGLVDLVARSEAELVVWAGTGHLSFEETGVTLRFNDRGLRVLGLDGYDVSWLDANKDGLADVLLTQGNRVALFTNRGRSFERVLVPALSQIGAFSGRPVAVDLAGHGGSAVAFSVGGGARSIGLDAPEVGLLIEADDGKGTRLRFDYARAASAPGSGSRNVVLQHMTTSSVGMDDVVYDYEYAEPRTHSAAKFLVGFGRVRRHSPTGVETSEFFNDDEHSGLLQTGTEGDGTGLEKVVLRDYEDAVSFGVPWKRLRQESSGVRSVAPLAARELLEVVRFEQYAREVCPFITEQTTAHGVLRTVTHPVDAPAHLGCLPKLVTMAGTHAEAARNFAQTWKLDRNAAGQLTALAQLGASGELVLQTVDYTDDGKVSRVAQPGRGETRLAYDERTRLLTSTTGPDGVVTRVVARAPSDAVASLAVTRGELEHVQSAAFDELERLRASWSNVGLGRESSPNQELTYQWADRETNRPAAVATTELVESGVWRKTLDVTAANGAKLASALRIPEGWAVSGLTRHERGRGRVEHFERAPLADAPSAMPWSALFEGAESVGSEVQRLSATEARVTFHAGVERVRTGATTLEDAVVVRQVENGTYESLTRRDAAGRVTEVRDAGGAAWQAGYDALGRLIEVRLPTGALHRTEYDDYGRVKVVERDGVARVAYRYDATTGLRVGQEWAGSGSSSRSVATAYDGVGRTVRETFHGEGDDEEHTFYWDGATPSEPARRDRSGLLTAVRGPGFTKTFEHRVDGLLTRTVLALDGFAEVVTTLAYDEAGAVSGRTTTVVEGGSERAKIARAEPRDAFGRPAGLTLGGAALASVGYDAEGLVAWATFGDARETVTFQHDRLTRRRTGVNVATPTWAAAMSAQLGARGQVVHEEMDVAGARRSSDYSYGPSGYLASSSNGETYRYDAAGLLTPSGPNTTVVDGLGRVIAREDLALTYGPRGHVREAARGARRWSFLYDETGRRIAKLEAGRVVAAYPEDGVHVDGAGELVEPVRLAGHVVGLLRPTGFEAIAADGRGTRVSSAAGAALFASPYGARAEHPGDAQAIDYAAKGWDGDLGVVRMGVRDYDPELGRFLQPDPLYLEAPARCLASPAQCNLYGYAANDPLTMVDPTGTDADGSSVGRRLEHLQSFLASHPEQTQRVRETQAASLVVAATALVVPARVVAMVALATMKDHSEAEVSRVAPFLVGTRWLGPTRAAPSAPVAAAEVAGEAAGTAGGGMVSLFRAVGPEELQVIQSSGRVPASLSGLESKYFSATAEGAASYARQAVRGFGDAPYTLVESQIARSQLPADVLHMVDGNVPAVILPNSHLPLLGPAKVWSFMPVP